MRLVIPSVGLMIIGGQLVMNAFVLALLAVEPKRDGAAAPAASMSPNTPISPQLSVREQ